MQLFNFSGPGMGQRVLLPAGSHQTIRISGNQSLTQIKSQLPHGTTILSSSDSSGQMLAFLPNNQSVIQQKVSLTFYFMYCVEQIYFGNRYKNRASVVQIHAALMYGLCTSTHSSIYNSCILLIYIAVLMVALH